MSNSINPPSKIGQENYNSSMSPTPTLNPFKHQTVNEKPRKNRLISMLITGLVVISLGTSALAYTSITRYDALLSSSNKEIENANSTIKELEDSVKLLQEDSNKKTELLNERQNFALALDNYKAALALVSGVFDTSNWSTQVETSITSVESSLNNVDLIKNETIKLENFTKEIYAALTDFKAKQSQAERDATNGVGTNPRKAMDAIDSSITITVVDQACNAPEAMACVSSANPKNVQVTGQYLYFSYEIWYMVMMHEYAHTVQFTNYNDFISSERFKTLFNSNPELHADCMAKAKIGETYVSNYGNVCSDEQTAAGNEAWSGIF
jgi:hypothetical protein